MGLEQQNSKVLLQVHCLKLEDTSFNNDMDLGEATLASMSATEFFEPATIDSDVYVGGDNVAKSPALLSYLHTHER